ncbi:hypothetical protein FQR65_LT17459 [Abscondita terminalis]|nr:hypothetical protein FQR65_LT17459 [Abscondita terminalis]
MYISANTETQNNEGEESVSSLTINAAPAAKSSCSRKRSKYEIDETDKAILKALEATSQALLPIPEIDEDTVFFKSITPSVRNFTEDEKLEFRMEVLQLIKQIKQKRYEQELRPSLTRSYDYPSGSSFSSYSTPTAEYQARDYSLEQI